jgi:hypothetical protein
MLTTLKIPFIVEQEAFSQTTSRKNTSNSKVVFVPPQDAKPKQSTGGASRNSGKCTQDDQLSTPSLTAVIPAQNKGLTSEATPTFLVYVPDTSAQKAFFSISEVTSDPNNLGNHYQTFLPIQQKAGVVKVSLPEEAPKLEVGKTYRWSFALICNTRLKPDSPRVEGLVERVTVNANLMQKLEQATALEKAVLYGQEGLWYDSTANLLQAYQAEPNNLSNIWQDLLKSEAVELEILSNQPILP